MIKKASNQLKHKSLLSRAMMYMLKTFELQLEILLNLAVSKSEKLFQSHFQLLTLKRKDIFIMPLSLSFEQSLFLQNERQI